MQEALTFTPHSAFQFEWPFNEAPGLATPFLNAICRTLIARIRADNRRLRDQINVARATIAGLQGLERPDVVAKRRGLPAEDFVPKGMLRAYNERKARGPVEGAH